MSPTSIYLLQGEDEWAAGRFIKKLQPASADPAMTEMNTVRLDGRTVSFESLEAAVAAMPFLAERRLVILDNTAACMQSEAARQRFLKLLERLPPFVILVLRVDGRLTDERRRKENRLHPLEQWVAQAKDRAEEKVFDLPSGDELIKMIVELVHENEGEITPQAASQLAYLVGEMPYLMDQEVQKLLAYVNYSRPIQREDVEQIIADMNPGDIFKMVDALAVRDGRRAIDMLHRLLKDRDPMSIFGMVVRQFRLLLQARELADQGASREAVTKTLKLHPFVAEKVVKQARQFSLPALEAFYHRLIEVEDAVKTSEMDWELAFDVFFAEFTQPAAL